MPGICKLEFAMGAHGMKFKAGTTEIEGVTCQARLLGVKEGWNISMVNGVAITESYQAESELLKCKKAGYKYVVYFRKDEASIRADNAKAEAERAKRLKAQEEARREQEKQRKIIEEAEGKRAEELAAKKQEYWDRQNAGGVAADVPDQTEEAPAAALAGDAPAAGEADAPPAGEGAEAPAEAAEAAPAEEAAPPAA
eukprot:CAMPEP_0206482242 /NCGR_PEP_ID=MMETSP0324_2-20121206/38767_1 /ASSEMBLY_ACC=CAM_ASM_000836 /TAXON_ID=2866 /ORGANISM="Crypthecodinium cohnii, Strain Seligo" /LENGTH=196 /DNA_ID=CAMNT_0053960171 /DNA_START=187 /DNA_END=777 /DNA_ORIENTATION=+